MAHADADPPAESVPRWLRLLPWSGAALGLLVVAVFATLLAAGSDQVLPMAAALGALAYAGKEGGIPIGISLGGEPFLVGGAILAADVALTLVLFPLVLAGMRGVEGRAGMVGRMLRSARRRADRRRHVVDRYGVAGLFVFLLIPFAFNGPLVGAVLGRLAGLSPLRSLATVLAAIGVTTVAWTCLYAYGFRELGLDPRLPMLLSLLIAATVVGSTVVAAWREREPVPAAA